VYSFAKNQDVFHVVTLKNCTTSSLFLSHKRNSLNSNIWIHSVLRLSNDMHPFVVSLWVDWKYWLPIWLHIYEYHKKDTKENMSDQRLCYYSSKDTDWNTLAGLYVFFYQTSATPISFNLQDWYWSCHIHLYSITFDVYWFIMGTSDWKA
jgi:hypothetical protein